MLNKGWVILLILGIAFFLRIINAFATYGFAADGELYSWIVKDILINGHIRLLGQETSLSGFYIGSLFYFLLVPFFLLFNMDPIGATIFVALVGTLTTLGYYFCFKKLFDERVGLIAAFFYATFITTVEVDRWVVPSVLVNIWSLFYFFGLIKIVKGEFKYLLVVGILIGLIWHIHPTLAPLIFLIPLSVFLSKKLPNAKNLFLFFLGLFIPLLPFFIFEIKNGFSLTKAVLNSFFISQGGGTGLEKVRTVLEHALGANYLFILVGVGGLYLVKSEILSAKIGIVLLGWFTILMLYFLISSKPSSEYYFQSYLVILITVVSLFLGYLSKLSKLLRYLVLIILIASFLCTLNQVINYRSSGNNYSEKKAAVEFIKMDAKSKNFPCISVSYITNPGENTGFRYFFFLNNLHINKPGSGSPNYTIVIPYGYSKDSVKATFGLIGVIPPEKDLVDEEVKKSCLGENPNLVDPLWGYTE